MMPVDMTPLLAHQGGWDEIAYLLVPIAVVIIGVRLAERRARQRAETEEETVESEDSPA